MALLVSMRIEARILHRFLFSCRRYWWLLRLFPLALIIVFGWLGYANTLQGPFQHDDDLFILHNPGIRNIMDLPAIWNSFHPPTRFLAFVTFALNYHIHRFDVAGYHLVNVIFHIMTAGMAGWFTLWLFRTPYLRRSALFRSYKFIALGTALVFVVHPLQTQAVSFITQRMTVMAAFFFVMSLCWYLKGRLGEGRGHRKFYYFGVALGAAVLGFFSKETVISLPLVIGLLEVSFFPGLQKRLLSQRILTSFLCVGIVAVFVGCIFFFDAPRVLGRTLDSLSHTGDIISARTYFLTQLRVLVVYLRLFIFPVNQNFDYDFCMSRSLFEGPTLISMGVLLMIIALAIRLRQHGRIFSFGLFWFFVTQIPESSVIPIRQVIAEHRVYLSAVGLSLLIGAAIPLFLRNKRLRWIVLGVLVVVLTLLTVHRNKVWHSNISLWEDVLRKSPHKSSARSLLGVYYFAQGEREKALESFNGAIQEDPLNALAFYNRANYYKLMGDGAQALSDYREAFRIDSVVGGKNSYLIRRGFFFEEARSFYDAGDLVAALEALKNLAGSTMDDWMVFLCMGRLYADLGQQEQAVMNIKMAETILEKSGNNQPGKVIEKVLKKRNHPFAWMKGFSY